MRSIFGVILLLGSGAVWPAVFLPPQDLVCTGEQTKTHIGRLQPTDEAQHVDKTLLAAWALDTYGIRRSYEVAVEKRPDLMLDTSLSPSMEILEDEHFCKTQEAPEGKFACTGDDAKVISTAHLAFRRWLDGNDPNYNFSKLDKDRPHNYFGDAKATIYCVAKSDSPPKKTQDGPPKTESMLSHLRVRGTTDGLGYDQGDPGFKATPGASFSVNRDDVSDKTTNKIVGVLGYQLFPHSNNSMDFEMVPYFGINRNLTSAKGKGDTVTANTRNVGIYIDFSFSNSKFDHVFTVRPDYLTDIQHHSNIESLGFVYQPFVLGWLNTNLPFSTSSESIASVMPILDLRIDTGHYNNCGTLALDKCANYTRIGSQFGVSINSNNINQPFTFTATDTRLIGMTDRAHDIDYLKYVLSYALNKDKSVSLDFSYSDGRREDTAFEERLWGISLGVKY